MLSGITTYAVDRFWRAAKVRDGATHAEPALAAFLATPSDLSSKLWAALLLHATTLEPDLLDDVIAALTAWKAGATPPSSLVRWVGFFRNGDCNTLDPLMQPAIDANRVLAALRSSDLLNHQSIAEIVLAVAGSKMSRISGHSALIADVAHVVEFPFFVGAQSIQAIHDMPLEGFSNRSVPSKRIKDLAEDCDAYAYFGGDVADQALLSVLDQLNAAGTFLGIPACCRAYFFSSWDVACRDHDGDLAFHLLSSQPQWTQDRQIEVAWQCNSYGMYFGGGLTWHFPCSVSCAATIEIVDKRFKHLSEIDATFARECRAFQQRAFVLSPDRTTASDGDLSRGVLILPIEAA